jgi:hypothetical protein
MGWLVGWLVGGWVGEWMGTPLCERFMYLVSPELDSEHKLPCGDVYNKQIWYDGYVFPFFCAKVS